MDANNITIITTLLIALISGLLAYSASLSSKENEIKLAVYEKLGTDAHSALESLQNNTEYLIQCLIYSKKINRTKLMEYNKKVPPKLDLLRDLHVRLMYFDMQVFKKYDATTTAHGELTPRMFGLGNVLGVEQALRDRNLSKYETKRYIFELRKILDLIEDTKKTVTTETSKRYVKTLNSSSKIKYIISIAVIIIIISICFFPAKKDEKQSQPTTNIFIIK